MLTILCSCTIKSDKKMGQKELDYVQHTESEHHLNGHAGAWGNWPLTKKGHSQLY